jgi:hypothetical protein
MSITAEYVYTEEVAIRASEEVTKSICSSFLVRLLTPLLVRWEATKRFRQNPSANMKVVWRFDEQKVEDSTDGASSVRVWNKFIEIREVDEGFLFFPQPRLAQWLPKSAFSSEADLCGLRELIRASGVKNNQPG